jgi:hypothetical protein
MAGFTHLAYSLAKLLPDSKAFYPKASTHRPQKSVLETMIK